MLRIFTIATTAAGDDMVPLHDRMLMILDPDDWPVWPGEEAGGPADLLRPASPGTVRLWPVSRTVNSVRNNGAELLHNMTDVAPLTPADAAVDINPA